MPFVPTIIIDTREQTPWLFPSEYPIVRKAMKLADYSILGFETRFAIERKSREDFISSIRPYNTRDPETQQLIRSEKGKAIRELRQGWGRFEREIVALRYFQFPCIIIECPFDDFVEGAYRGGMSPESVVGRIAGLMVEERLRIVFAKDATNAAMWFQLLMRAFIKNVEDDARLIGMDRRARKPENNEFQSAASAEGEE